MEGTIPDGLWFPYMSHNNSEYFTVDSRESKNDGHLMKMKEDAALTRTTNIPDGESNKLFTLDILSRTLRGSTPLLTGGPRLGLLVVRSSHPVWMLPGWAQSMNR